MSKASQLRRVRKLNRSIGKLRMTRQQLLDGIAARTIKRVIRAVGRENVRIMQDTSFSMSLETTSDKVERILLEEGYLRMRSGEFVHRKMRISDLVGIGAMISVVPNDPNPPPEVSAEAVKRIEELLSSTEAVRLDDIA